MSSTTHHVPDTDPAPQSAGPRQHRTGRWLAGGAAVALLAGGGFLVWDSQLGTPSVGEARVAVATVPEVGDVLVDGQGKVLYLFEPDQAASVTCTGGCAEKWPPLTLADGPLPAGPGVDAALLGQAPGEDGQQVATYAGWPLYRYESDDLTQATGHGDDDNGGVWLAITPAGQPAA